MARKKQQPEAQDFVVVDEQGDFYPPGTALAAFLEGFTNEPQFDGTLVEVGAYLADEMLFEVLPVNRVLHNGDLIYGAGETIFVYVRELRPVNVHTQKYIEAATAVKAEMYEMDVYDLRDRLAEVGINVTAEAIATWTGAQRSKIWIYATTVGDDKKLVMPPELQR